MIRRSGNKIYTKVTQYFTDNSSTVGYSHTLTSPTESFCGTNFYYEQRLTSSLANGKWRDCLYGPFTFCSGSTSGSACSSGNCDQFYLDTSAINIDYTGVVVDEASNVTLYTGSRLYLSSSLELAPDGYYVSGGVFYKVGNGNCCGINNGTFISSGSCPTSPATGSIYINNTNSLNIPITGMTINGVAVTFELGTNFTIAAGNNGTFSTSQTGSQTVVISYGTHTPGQNIVFTDSNNNITCETLNGPGGSFTISSSIITAGTTISVVTNDGVCP